jgi:hypothetical protein
MRYRTSGIDRLAFLPNVRLLDAPALVGLCTFVCAVSSGEIFKSCVVLLRFPSAITCGMFLCVDVADPRLDSHVCGDCRRRNRTSNGQPSYLICIRDSTYLDSDYGRDHSKLMPLRHTADRGWLLIAQLMQWVLIGRARGTL